MPHRKRSIRTLYFPALEDIRVHRLKRVLEEEEQVTWYRPAEGSTGNEL